MRRKKPALKMQEMPERAHESVSTTCRQIDNGYIVSRDHYKSDGSGTHSEVYHPTKPDIAVTSPAAPKKRAPAKFTLKKRARRK